MLTQSTGLNAWTGAPLAPLESTAPTTGVSDPAGDAHVKAIGGTNVPGADIRDLRLALTDDVLRVSVKIAGDRLSAAAAAAALPWADLVVRWQVGDKIYHASVEESAIGGPQFYAGEVQTVDLCSVSGCKPNYMVYPAPPAVGGVSATGGLDADTYTIDVPLAAVGNPTETTLFEEVMAFVSVAPRSAALQADNGTAFADSVPVQIEGTKTFNYRAGAAAAPPAGNPPGGNPGGNPGSNPGGSGGGIPTTGSGPLLVTLGMCSLVGALALRRRQLRRG